MLYPVHRNFSFSFMYLLSDVFQIPDFMTEYTLDSVAFLLPTRNGNYEEVMKIKNIPCCTMMSRSCHIVLISIISPGIVVMQG